MRLMNRFSLAAVFAASTASLAMAETPNTNPSVEPGAFADVIEMRLDDEFEKSAVGLSDEALGRLGGPSSMSCSHALTQSDLETCVVTADGTPTPAMPAALAQH